MNKNKIIFETNNSNSSNLNISCINNFNSNKNNYLQEQDLDSNTYNYNLDNKLNCLNIQDNINIIDENNKISNFYDFIDNEDENILDTKNFVYKNTQDKYKDKDEENKLNKIEENISNKSKNIDNNKVKNVKDFKEETKTELLELKKENNSYINNNNEIFIMCYNKFINILQDNNYNIDNWTILIIKALQCVSNIKETKLSISDKKKIVIDMIVLYLENNVSKSEDVIKSEDFIKFIKQIAPSIIDNIINNQGINKIPHKKNLKDTIKIQKNIQKDKGKIDLDILASQTKIINTVIYNIELIIKTKKYNNEEFITNIINLIMSSIIFIDKYTYLNTFEKKYIAIEAFKLFFKNNITKLFKLDEEQNKAINYIIDSLPLTIETCMNIINGDKEYFIKFKKVKTIHKYFLSIYNLLKIFKC